MPEYAEKINHRDNHSVNRTLSRRKIKKCITKRDQALFWYFMIQKIAGLILVCSSLYLTITEKDLTYFILCGFMGLYLMITGKIVLH